MEPRNSKSGTGVPPVQGFVASWRSLPHWQESGSVYFITWRCRPGVTLVPEDRTIVLDSLRYWDQRKWDLYAAVVMPDHVHTLAQPLPGDDGMGTFDLSEIVHSVKSFSAHQINKLRGRKGPIWQDERFDRIVRDEGELQEKWEYIRHNPVKAGLAATPEEYPWLYERAEEHRPEACATKKSNSRPSPQGVTIEA